MQEVCFMFVCEVLRVREFLIWDEIEIKFLVFFLVLRESVFLNGFNFIYLIHM